MFGASEVHVYETQRKFLLGSDEMRYPRAHALLAAIVVAYPWLLTGFYASGRLAAAGGIGAVLGWTGAVLLMAAALAVPTVAFGLALTVTAGDAGSIALRRVALLVVAVPPLFTATG